jgi:dihydropteroate synthase
MGILNVTPDSFSDGGLFQTRSSAVRHAKGMVAEGADILDIGGESTRPWADPVPLDVELKRVIPVIRAIRKLKSVKVPISIDTMKPEVARQALLAGANILNDVGGFRDEGMVRVAEEFGVPVVVMHMKGTPQTMQAAPRYKNVVDEILFYFEERLKVLTKRKIRNIILDPGIGFGKKVKHNLEILNQLSRFRTLGYPLLIGLSRKSFLGKSLKLDVDNRLHATVAANALSIWNGADIIRVHDVKENLLAARMADLIRDPELRRSNHTGRRR